MESNNPVDEKPSLELQEPALAAQPIRQRREVSGIQATWKMLLFFFLGMGLGPAVFFELGQQIWGAQLRGSYSLPFLIFQEFGWFATVLGTTALLALMEKNPVGTYGLPGKFAFKGNFWIGFLFGLAEVSLVVGIIEVLGGYSFGSWALPGSEIFAWGMVHLFFFVCVGLYEELLFRGYAQFTLSKFIGFWPAAFLLSTAFGLVHLANRGENWTGALNVMFVGLFFAFTLKRSGHLWYAVGMHAGFDWAQSFLYSVPDSGQLFQGHLSNAVLQGPAWLTGGSVGPEGSVFSYFTMGLQFLVVLFLFPAKKEEPAAETAAIHS